jgi:hypothetical protein
MIDVPSINLIVEPGFRRIGEPKTKSQVYHLWIFSKSGGVVKAGKPELACHPISAWFDAHDKIDIRLIRAETAGRIGLV